MLQFKTSEVVSVSKLNVFGAFKVQIFMKYRKILKSQKFASI